MSAEEEAPFVGADSPMVFQDSSDLSSDPRPSRQKSVRKRDAKTLQVFDRNKIVRAVRGAWIECGRKDSGIALSQIALEVEGFVGTSETISVEKIQDAVEIVLMRQGYFDVAKAYIIFRQNRIEARQAEARLKALSTTAMVIPTPQRNLTMPRRGYKPFEYPKYFGYFQKQNQAHWMPLEVPMENDIIDFKKNLNSAERNLIVNILRFFTQSDIEVNNNYNTRLIPAFPKPEIAMMLSSFAAMESIHVWAYSYLNDSLGLPETEYSAFLTYEAMRAKYNYLKAFDVNSPQDLAVNLAVFGGFIEGVSLFSSFAILMNFPRLGKLKGVGQIVSWSIRDESLHSRAVCELFRDYIAENSNLWTKDLRQLLTSACRDMVKLEDAFVDVCFAEGPVPGLTAEEVKRYVRYIADRKLGELGLDPIFGANENPLKWLDILVNGKEHANFFEGRATEYAKGGVVDDWG